MIIDIMKKIHYSYIVQWNEEENAYIGSCLEYPFLIAKGISYENAFESIKKMVTIDIYLTL